jgi:hypothetical protein
MYAEARVRLEKGEKWWDMPGSLAESEQDSRLEMDDLYEKALMFLWSEHHTEKNHTPYGERTKDCRYYSEGVNSRDFVKHVLFNGMTTFMEPSRRDDMRIANLLKGDLKMDRKLIMVDGARLWRYFVTDKTPRIDSASLITPRTVEEIWATMS